MAVLISLPTSWDSFTSTIELKDLDSTDDKICKSGIDSIQLRIKGEWAHRVSRDGKPSGSAFSFQKSNNPSHFSSNKPDKVNSECNYCHKKGHWAKECRKRISDERKKNNANISTQERESNFSFSAYSTPETQNSLWIGDSRADEHVVSEKTAFISYAETPGRFVTGVGGIKVPILGKGSVATVMCSGSSSQNIILYNCLHIPSNQPNLLSLSHLDRAGGSIRIKSGSIQLFDSTGISICDGKADGRLYKLNMHSTSNLTPSTFSSNNPRGQTWEEWHKVMGHINVQSLKLMKEKNLVEGMEVIQSPLEFICEACIQGKQVTKPLPKKSQTLYSEIGELILTDLWGPAQVKGKGGFEYFISFMDAATHFSVVGFLK